MKTGKTALSLIFSLVIGMFFLLTGCPGLDSSPPESGIIFGIMLEPSITNGIIDVEPRQAAENTTVTIRATPNSGYEVMDPRARDFDNFPIPLTAAGDENTWTFTMPGSSVMIGADFIPTFDALDRAISRLSVNSSWDEIAIASTFVRRAQDALSGSTTAADEQRLNAAITALTGTETDIGLIRRKMRNEDLTAWLPLGTRPSYPMDKGADMGDDRTHLYFIRENNPTLPALVLGRGWREGTRQPNYTEPPVGEAYAGVIRVPLIYDVGQHHSVTYNLLFCPVAQYTIQYEGTATGTVRITELATPPKGPPRTRELNVNTPSRIGEVGRPPAAGVDVHSIIAEIQIVPPGTGLITVKNSDGYVTILNGFAPLRDIDTTANPVRFFPESRNYIIVVRPAP